MKISFMAIGEFTAEAIEFVLSVLIVSAIVFLLLPESVFGQEEPWGYEYVPVVITWYDGLPKKTQELESFKAKGAFADTAKAEQDCEDKAKSVIKSWGDADEKFMGLVLCVKRPLTKPIKKEPEKK